MGEISGTAQATSDVLVSWGPIAGFAGLTMLCVFGLIGLLAYKYLGKFFNLHGDAINSLNGLKEEQVKTNMILTQIGEGMAGIVASNAEIRMNTAETVRAIDRQDDEIEEIKKKVIQIEAFRRAQR